MKLKKLLSLVIAVVCLAAVCVPFTSCNNDEEKYTIGICQLIQHSALDAATKGFKDALIAEFGEENVEFIEQNAQGDSNTCSTIVNDLVNKRVDLILANATAPLQAAANATATIPILGTSVTDYGTALNISNWNGVAGGNISGTTDLAPLDKQADMILELYPDAKTVGVIYCAAEPNSEYQYKVIKDYLATKGVTVNKHTFNDGNDAAAVSAAAAAANDVLYIPTDNTAAACTETILGAIGNAPLIAGESGICSGCGVATLSIDYYDLGFTTGKMAAKILKGEADISTMKVESVSEFTKMYNKSRCDSLGIDTAALEAKGYTAIK